jgi:hypothetical protein
MSLLTGVIVSSVADSVQFEKVMDAKLETTTIKNYKKKEISNNLVNKLYRQ